jgi:hypothetical protein
MLMLHQYNHEQSQGKISAMMADPSHLITPILANLTKLPGI